jgi:transcriptional regulator GlxA family with amidase domain
MVQTGNYRIGIPVYPKLDLLDVAAPYELFNWMAAELKGQRDVSVELIGQTTDMIKTRDGLAFSPHQTFTQRPSLDLLWVPGGDPEALKAQMADRTFMQYLISASQNAEYIASVCEGALLLAEVGLLNGYEATTHWAFLPCFQKYPKVQVAPGNPRFIVDARNGDKGIRVTGGGISSGLDEALELVRRIAGLAVAEQVQLNTQYLPKPPISVAIPVAPQCPL